MAVLLYELCGRDPALRFSPYCWRARMALAHKGLAAETVPTPYKRIAEIGDGSFKAVPVLADGDQYVDDSFEIALYLDRAYPDRPPLFEGDAHVAASRLIETWANTTFGPLIMRMICLSIWEVLEETDRPYFRETREKRFGQTLEENQTGIELNAASFASALEPARRVLQDFAWLGGPEPRFADYIVFGSLMWLTVIAGAMPLPADDAVAQWFERCLDLHDGMARQAPRARGA